MLCVRARGAPSWQRRDLGAGTDPFLRDTTMPNPTETPIPLDYHI